jgi:hypothetical protein
MFNSKTLVLMLAYVEQKVHGVGASKGAGHFSKEQYVFITKDTVQYQYTCFCVP